MLQGCIRRVAKTRDPVESKKHRVRAGMLVQEGNFSAAIKAYELCLFFDPVGGCFEELGIELLRSGQKARGRSCLDLLNMDDTLVLPDD